MNERQFYDAIKAVGIETFVKYYYLTRSLSLSNNDIVEVMQDREGYTLFSCRVKVSASRRLIKNGQAQRAMQYAAASPRVPAWVRKKARMYLPEDLPNETQQPLPLS